MKTKPIVFNISNNIFENATLFFYKNSIKHLIQHDKRLFYIFKAKISIEARVGWVLEQEFSWCIAVNLKNKQQIY
jgi:hypothetical protein